jgi:predicted enzyme related to lactoylglutathione lyase
MTITSFEIISIPVSDPQAAKAFYQHTLGFALINESPMGPEMTWIQLAPKGSATTIALVTWFPNMKPGGVQGLMFNTDDLDADHAALTAKGVKLSAISSEPWGRYATFNDPDGNGLIIRQAHAA